MKNSIVNRALCVLILILSDDIETNLGPGNASRVHCRHSEVHVFWSSVWCDDCDICHHHSCLELCASDYACSPSIAESALWNITAANISLRRTISGQVKYSQMSTILLEWLWSPRRRVQSRAWRSCVVGTAEFVTICELKLLKIQSQGSNSTRWKRHPQGKIMYLTWCSHQSCQW